MALFHPLTHMHGELYMPFKVLITDVVFEPEIEQEILGDDVEISADICDGSVAICCGPLGEKVKHRFAQVVVISG